MEKFKEKIFSFYSAINSTYMHFILIINKIKYIFFFMYYNTKLVFVFRPNTCSMKII